MLPLENEMRTYHNTYCRQKSSATTAAEGIVSPHSVGQRDVGTGLDQTFVRCWRIFSARHLSHITIVCPWDVPRRSKYYMRVGVTRQAHEASHVPLKYHIALRHPKLNRKYGLRSHRAHITPCCYASNQRPELRALGRSRCNCQPLSVSGSQLNL